MHRQLVRAFSDGSLKRDKDSLTYALYFPGIPRENASVKLTNTSNNVSRAELAAIIHALLVTHTHSNLTIYSDSEVSVKLINNIAGAIRSREKHPDLGDLLELAKIILDKRAQANSKTLILHTHSHLLDHKMDKEERERRWRNMRERFGDGAEEIAAGNRKADEMAEAAHKIKQTLPLPVDTRCLGGWLLTDKQSPIRRVILKPIAELRERQREEWWKKLTKTKHYRSYLNPHLLATIDAPLSSFVVNLQKAEDNEVRIFAQRMRRKLTLDNATKRKRLEQSSGEWRRKMEKSAPKDDRCPFQCGATDERMHVFTCIKTAKHRSELAAKVLEIFNRASRTKLQAIPLWFSAPAGRAPPHQDEQLRKLWRAVESFPKDMGNMGFVPRSLTELFVS